MATEQTVMSRLTIDTSISQLAGRSVCGCAVSILALLLPGPVSSQAAERHADPTFVVDAIARSYHKGKHGHVRASLRLEMAGSKVGVLHARCARRAGENRYCHERFEFFNGTIWARGFTGTGTGALRIYRASGSYRGVAGKVRAVGRRDRTLSKYSFYLGRSGASPKLRPSPDLAVVAAG